MARFLQLYQAKNESYLFLLQIQELGKVAFLFLIVLLFLVRVVKKTTSKQNTGSDSFERGYGYNHLTKNTIRAIT